MFISTLSPSATILSVTWACSIITHGGSGWMALAALVTGPLVVRVTWGIFDRRDC